ncbi:hypothetical protein BC628DRAFT_1307504 [Trametes gibbosa]|nr:hypothetical protein BC628DRAFT_1307504 [Trametes gibbosa]
MSNFAALMALSASQTRQSDAAVQSALAERERKEAQKRKEMEEKERRDRELQAKLRVKRLEEQKREQERRQRQEAERQAKERELQRREDQRRDALRYGPKKARTDGNGYPVSGAARRRTSSDDDDDNGATALTREEKRKRRLEAELRGNRGSVRRAITGGGYNKPGRRLPGGAVDITTTLGSVSLPPSTKGQSIKERLASEPMKLIKLNVNKRDTRTIDEIVRDREKARQGKILDGDQAREFSDWFGKAKKEPPKKPDTSTTSSRANTPAIAGPSSGSQSKVASGSGSPHSFSSAASKTQPPYKAPLPSMRASANTPAKPGGASKAALANKPSGSTSSNLKTATTNIRTPNSAPSKVASSASKQPIKKRPRSPSSSVSPPPAKRRPAPASSARNDISSEIWKLFGKDRSSYIQRDVYSDDEDMEADAFDVEREEMQSMRIAKREDELAMEEERRHEEEKRRRRKEKEKRGSY